MYNSQKTIERIKQKANEKNMSPAEVLRAAGLAKSTLQNMEKSEPRCSVIERIADELDVSTDYLLCRTDSENPTVTSSLSEFDLANILSDLSYDELKRIKNYIDYLIANK